MTRNELQMSVYFSAIDRAESLADLDRIVELAADDDEITNKQYEQIYDRAFMKIHQL